MPNIGRLRSMAGPGDLTFGTPPPPAPVAGGGGNTPNQGPPHFTDPSGTTTPDGWYSEDGGRTWKDRDGRVRSVDGVFLDEDGDPIRGPQFAMPGFEAGQKRLMSEADRRVQPYGARTQADYDRASKIFDEGAVALGYQKQLAAGNDPRIEAAWQNSAFAGDQGLQAGLSRMGSAPAGLSGAATRAAMLANSRGAATNAGGALGAQLGLMGQGQDQLARAAYQRSQQASKLREGTLRQDQFGAQLNDQRERFFDSMAAQRAEANREMEERNKDRLFGQQQEQSERRSRIGAATLDSFGAGMNNLMASAGKYAETPKKDGVDSDPRKKTDIRPLGVHSPGDKKFDIRPQVPGAEMFEWGPKYEGLRRYGIEPSGDDEQDRGVLTLADAAETSNELKRKKIQDDASQPGGSIDREYLEAFGKKKSAGKDWSGLGLMGEFLALGGGAAAASVIGNKWANRTPAPQPQGRLRLPRYGINSPVDKKKDIKSEGTIDKAASWLKSLFSKPDVGPLNNAESYYRPAKEGAASGATIEKPVTVSKRPGVLEKNVDRTQPSASPQEQPTHVDDSSDVVESRGPRNALYGLSALPPWLTEEALPWMQRAPVVTSGVEKKKDAKAQGFAEGVAAASGASDGKGLRDFEKWYGGHARKWGLSQDWNDPEHFYDYPAAFRAGAEPDATGHWPSQFKKPGHPREVLPVGPGGSTVNTRTGEPTENGKERGLLDYLVGDYGFDPFAPAKKAEAQRNAAIKKKGLVPPPRPSAFEVDVTGSAPLPGSYDQSMASALPAPPGDSYDQSMASRLPPPPENDDWRKKLLLNGISGQVGFGINSPADKKKNIELQSDDIKRELQKILVKQHGDEFAGLPSLKTRDRGVLDYLIGDYGFDMDAKKPEQPQRKVLSQGNAAGTPPTAAPPAQPAGLPPAGGLPMPEQEDPVPWLSQAPLNYEHLKSGNAKLPPQYPLTVSDPKRKGAKEPGETDIDRTMDTFVPFSFKYKDPADSQIGDDPKAAADDHPGIMADIAEKGPFGNVIVDNTPTGKMLRGPQMISALAASVGRLHERLRKVEGEDA